MSHVFFRDVRKEHPVIVGGEGVYLFDDQGRRYLDGCSGALVANIGHGVEPVARAIYEQARKVAFTHLSRFSSLPIQRLAELIATISPPGLNRVYFVSGGSEATETALKLSRQYFLERDKNSQKHLVISRWHCFHGNTLGALSMTGLVPRRKRYTPYLLNFPKINPPYCYRCPHGRTPPDCRVPCAYELEVMLKQVGPEYVAAFIAEPVVGAAAGALVPPPEYLPTVRQICDRYDILLIADEVMCGFGRTGRHFAVDHWGVVPDVITAAKGMAAGYAPLGAAIVHEKIWEVFRQGSGRFEHGHTYGGNPLACAAGAAVLEYYLEHDLVSHCRQLGELLLAELAPLKDNPVVGDVRGLGLMLGVELVQDRATRTPLPASRGMAEVATQFILKQGVVVYPGNGMVDGVAGDQFLIGPPLVINEAEVRQLAQGVIAGLDELARELA